MDRACNESLRKTLELTETMLYVAEEGDLHREDVGCGILYATLRDSAYKIRQLAEKEKEAHIRKGWWPEKRKEMAKMATFKCTKCGFEKEGRCKPQKCPECGEKKTFEKKAS